MPRFTLNLLHPRYWLTWVGFGLWWLLAQLPYRWQMALGRALGRLVWRLAKSRRRTALRNLALCFPEKPVEEQRAMARATVTSTAQALFETGISWFWPDSRLRRLFTIEGLEHLKAAQSEGQGVVLLAMHVTHLDLGGNLLCMSHSIDALYRPHDNPVYDFIQARGRSRRSDDTVIIDREDMRLMIKRLRRGRVVWYAPDQDYGPRRPHVFAPFFGVPAATITATSKLVQMGRARIIPFTHFRRDDGSGYDVKIYPPLENFPEGDELRDAERINRVLERLIRKHPEQYMWVHRRFKTRPEGEESLYSPKPK